MWRRVVVPRFEAVLDTRSYLVRGIDDQLRVNVSGKYVIFRSPIIAHDASLNAGLLVVCHLEARRRRSILILVLILIEPRVFSFQLPRPLAFFERIISLRNLVYIEFFFGSSQFI